MVGPIAGAKVTDSANIASPTGCWALGSLVSTMVKAIGMRTPPANPWRPRITIMDGRSWVKAHATENNANRIVLAVVVTVRPTVFLEGFFLQLAAPGVRASDELALPLGGGKTSPISAVDVSRAVAAILDDPAPHIGQIYDLTGPESADLNHYARVFSQALGRPIRYRDVPLPAWSESLRHMRFPEHVVRHLSAMAELTRQGRYDRMTDTMRKLTGEAPTNMRDFVKLHAAEFKQRGPAHS